MEIKILGPGCKKCEKTEKHAKAVVSELGLDVGVEKVTDMMEIAGYGVMGTPAVVINGIVKCSGKVPSKKEIKTWIESV